MADVCITEYTDPGCPWAYSAEPFRRRLSWLYGDALEWRVRMVGLAASPDEYLERGFTPERQSRAFASIARDHGMPIDTSVRPRMAATMPACRAVVAARLHAPDRMRRLLRRLRVRHFAGELLDEPATIAAAARDAGIDPADLERWTAGDDVETALREDMAASRHPIDAARVLDEKLANWSGGRRYTCPSYEIVRVADGVKIAVPGFQPFPVYDVVTANLVPGVDRRDPPGSVEEVLAWTGTPLATKEVAVVCDIGFAEARERLGRTAVEQHVGADGFWTLDGAGPARAV
jgi:predicted DsbA family dithiol-disulfide isomerase